MTLTVNTPNHVNTSNHTFSRTVPPAAVWDLHPSRSLPSPALGVRTLAPVDRTGEPSPVAGGVADVRARSFEQRRENGKVTLLGLAVGAVLVIGTVIGVNEGASSQGPGQFETVTAVTAK